MESQGLAVRCINSIVAVVCAALNVEANNSDSVWGSECDDGELDD